MRRRRNRTYDPANHLPPARVRPLAGTVVLPESHTLRPYATAATTAQCACGVEVRRGDHILRRAHGWACHNCTTALLHPSELGVYR